MRLIPALRHVAVEARFRGGPRRSRNACSRVVTAALVSALASSCGAATALDFDPPTKDAPSQDNPPTNDTSPPKPDRQPPQQGNADGNGKDPSIDLPTFELPECTRGAKPNTVPECPYLAEGLCYNDVESACACVCSGASDSFCFEGLFLNEWNGVDVWCSER